MMHGDEAEMNKAAHFVAQLNPVVALKSIGGASELMARIFELEKIKKANEEFEKEIREEERDLEDAMEDRIQAERAHDVFGAPNCSSSPAKGVPLCFCSKLKGGCLRSDESDEKQTRPEEVAQAGKGVGGSEKASGEGRG